MLKPVALLGAVFMACPWIYNPVTPTLSVQPEACQWGSESGGIRIGIHRLIETAETPDRPSFRVAIQNVGKADLFIHLGTMVGNGRGQFTAQLTLILTDQTGRQIRLENNFGHLPGIAGRLDPMLVPLPVGCSYIVPVDFDRYWFLNGVVPQDWLPAGDYSVVAGLWGENPPKDFQHDMIPSLPYWVGVVKSGTVMVSSPGRLEERAAPPDKGTV